MMGSDKQITVAIALSPDPELLPVVDAVVSRLAEQMGFEESQRFNLQQGIQQACRCALENCGGRRGEELRLEFSAFSDRLEVVVEDGQDATKVAEADSFLLNQLLDRVAFEETGEGKLRMTLVKYLDRVGSDG